MPRDELEAECRKKGGKPHRMVTRELRRWVQASRHHSLRYGTMAEEAADKALQVMADKWAVDRDTLIAERDELLHCVQAEHRSKAAIEGPCVCKWCQR